MHAPARFACLAMLALPALALAQTDDTAVPPATCVKPTVPAPGTALDQKASDKLNADTKTYAACGEAYMKARRAVADKYQLIVNSQVNAANSFAVDFNAFATQLDTFSKSQNAKAEKTKK